MEADGNNSPIIDRSSEDHFMNEALRQARMAYDSGEVPVGAVIVHNGAVIARSSTRWNS